MSFVEWCAQLVFKLTVQFSMQESERSEQSTFRVNPVITGGAPNRPSGSFLLS